MESSASPPKRSQRSLNIIQWNADGLSTAKVAELSATLADKNIDVVAVQETKWRGGNRTPRFAGYATVRLDRQSPSGGGGLVTLVRESLVFERISELSSGGTEALSIRVKLTGGQWITIVNLYCPPVRSHSRGASLNLAHIPTHADSLIVGDFNAHSSLWDEVQPEDDRGVVVLDWSLEKDLHVLNDGSPTRMNTSRPGTCEAPTQGLSTPDVSLCGSKWRNLATWGTVDDIGGSDHLPIRITINHRAVLQPITPLPRWRCRDVDWEAYSREVERIVDGIDMQVLNVHKASRALNEAILRSATLHVGTTRKGRRSDPWMTPQIREAIRNRNRLRKQLPGRKSEWLDAAKATRALITEAKTEAWRRVLEDASSTDDRRMWGVIRGLSGSPDGNAPNEAMRVNGRLTTTNKGKADAFVAHYAAVSRLPLTSEDRAEERALKKRLRCGPAPVPDFTAEELRTALANMKPRGAPGPDNISPALLQNLGPTARAKLLDLANISLHSSTLPQSWRNANVIPILKSGKPASEMGSFRPISLTSCVCKLVERMLSERIYFISESRGWLSPAQAGFRKRRGVEDQILRASQAIWDGFQRREKSILVLLDFSKAYDRVWRRRLLHSLLDRGLPLGYVSWLAGYLDNRQARVMFNGVLSRSRKFVQGLPQGSVLAPVLFLLYINSLAEALPKTITPLLYADDVAILATHSARAQVAALAQGAIDKVVEWAEDYKLTLNKSKSEAIPFSMDTGDARGWSPGLLIGGEDLKISKTAGFLGVRFDRALTFGDHVATIKTRAAGKLRMLAAVAHSSWGWRKSDLKKVFLSHIGSLIHYAGSGWQPWLSASRVRDLQMLQNRALRIITTQAASSPEEALHAETRILPVAQTIRAALLRSREKALRLPRDHPRRVAFEGSCPQRLKRRGARAKALEWGAPYDAFPRSPLNTYNVPPWERKNQIQIYDTLPGLTADPAQAKSLAIARARELNPSVAIYTDGSADAGTARGGASAVVTTGDPETPSVVTQLRRRGAEITCSYEEELRAMHMAVEWAASLNDATQGVAIFTDSQSLCTALKGTSPALDDLRSRLASATPTITIQWVPGHCGVPGNELADEAAKAATSGAREPGGVSFNSIGALIRRDNSTLPSTHARTAEVYSAYSEARESTISTRRDQALLAKLRSGHFVGLMAYRSRIQLGTDPSCPLCDEGCPQDLEHWVRCPALTRLRHDTYGSDETGLDMLTRSPRNALALARSSLLGASQSKNI